MDGALDDVEVRATSVRRARRRSRLLALALGVLAVLVLIEGGWWVASLFLTPKQRFSPGDRVARLERRPGERRVVCIGDSNTYGVHLEPDESYPGQLQALLDRAPDEAWRVINLGYPAQNSAQVRARLAQNLAAYRPEVVVCWIGVNNSWSRAMGHLWDEPEGEPGPGVLQGLLQRSRTLSLFRMLRNRTQGASVPGLDGAERDAGQGDVEIADRTRAEAMDVRRRLLVDLPRIQAICEEHGARLVLVTYPIDREYVRDAINRTIRDFASERELPLVDLERTFLPLFPEIGGRRLMFTDYHATALGNYEVSRSVLATLLDAGALPDRKEWRDVPRLAQVLPALALRVREQTGRDLVLDLVGQPRWRFELFCEPLFADAGEVSLARANGRAPEELDLEVGQLGVHGTRRVRIQLPELTGGDAPAAGERGVGWRVTARFRPPEEHDSRPPSTSSVDVRVAARAF